MTEEIIIKHLNGEILLKIKNLSMKVKIIKVLYLE